MTLRLHKTGIEFPDGSWQMTAGNGLPYRNLIINGDMRIAQRGTSVSGISSSNTCQTVDRFVIRLSSAGTFTISQDTDAPSGFSNSLKLVCTTANASLDSGAFSNIQQRIESQNLQHLAFGTSSAKQFTVSFWVKSSKTGEAVLRVSNADGGVAQSQLYRINEANTWEYKTLTFTADTNNGFDNDNGVGLNLYWFTSAGTDRTSGTLHTSTWEPFAKSDEAAGQTINIADTVGNYINITGVQLEVGDTATPFEHKPYDVELARAQRYYYKITGLSGQGLNCVGYASNPQLGVFTTSFPVQMRSRPTSLETTGTASDYSIRYLETSTICDVVPSFYASSELGADVKFHVPSGTLIAGQGCMSRVQALEAYLAWSAEL